MAFRLALVLTLPVALAHSPIGTNGERFRGTGRRLWNLAAQESHIWGKCDEWDHKVAGCELNSQYKCSAYLSEGPAEYDLEITLGNVTASKPGHPVHLAWWAPRKSETVWNPHISLAGCAVYGWMNHAYPKYGDADFNGGNQQVGTDGKVTIRVKAPATYFVTNWISVPHIHLRVCSNDTFAHTTQDAIVFVKNGAELVAGEAGSNLQILSVKNMTYTTSPGSGQVQDRRIVGILVWRQGGSVGTTTPMPNGLVEEIIDDEMAKMNWDALEFSPIYQCFMEEKLFDHFTAQCTDECGSGAVVARGQCVRPERGVKVETVASWTLSVQCNEACWTEWKNKTLHYTRLAVADMLDIPFQEVERAGLAFHTSRRLEGERRLQDGQRSATVQAYINTKRLTVTEINTLVPQVFESPASATEIMNFPVSSVSLERLANDGIWNDMLKNDGDTADYVSNANDPYEDAYRRREPGGVQTIGGIPTGGLPMGVIVGIAVAVLLFGFAVGFCIFYRRKKAITELGGNERVVTAAGTIIGSGANPGKKVEDDGVPATANNSPEELARKAQDAW